MASANSTESYRAAVDQIRLDVTEAMALCAVLGLGLFTTLSERPMTAEELSATIEVKPRRLKMLL